MVIRDYRWSILFLALFLAAFALQAGLMIFALYALAGLMIASRYFARTWLANLEVTRESGIQEPVAIGTSVEIHARITNKGTRSILWVLIEDLLPATALRQKPPRLRLKGKRLKLLRLPGRGSALFSYTLICDMRGYYQIGPIILETGDLFGLHRRHRIMTEANYLLVLPRIVPLPKYDFSSQRPIGEINSAHRLFEDPTRHAGVRAYQIGDPLQRVHWRATARTGQLMCRILEPTSLAGATILLDFNLSGFQARGEPYRSELAITTACSLAYAVTTLNQQIGFVSNGRDAADRRSLKSTIQVENDEGKIGFDSREQARSGIEMSETSDRLRPVIVETRRGIDQFQQIHETLARLELSDGQSFAQLVLEVTPRLPRDATIIAILPVVPVECSSVLGMLRRQGFAVSVVLIAIEDDNRSQAQGRLLAENIRDIRHVQSEEELAMLGQSLGAVGPNPYSIEINLA